MGKFENPQPGPEHTPPKDAPQREGVFERIGKAARARLLLAFLAFTPNMATAGDPPPQEKKVTTASAKKEVRGEKEAPKLTPFQQMDNLRLQIEGKPVPGESAETEVSATEVFDKDAKLTIPHNMERPDSPAYAQCAVPIVKYTGEIVTLTSRVPVSGKGSFQWWQPMPMNFGGQFHLSAKTKVFAGGRELIRGKDYTVNVVESANKIPFLHFQVTDVFGPETAFVAEHQVARPIYADPTANPELAQVLDAEFPATADLLAAGQARGTQPGESDCGERAKDVRAAAKLVRMDAHGKKVSYKTSSYIGFDDAAAAVGQAPQHGIAAIERNGRYIVIDPAAPEFALIGAPKRMVVVSNQDEATRVPGFGTMGGGVNQGFGKSGGGKIRLGVLTAFERHQGDDVLSPKEAQLAQAKIELYNRHYNNPLAVRKPALRGGTTLAQIPSDNQKNNESAEPPEEK